MESCNMEEMIHLMMEPVVPVLDLDHMDLNIACPKPTIIPSQEFTGQNPSSVVLHPPFTTTSSLSSSSSSSSSSRCKMISFANPAASVDDDDDKVTVTDSGIHRKSAHFQNMNLNFLEDVEGEDHEQKQQRSPKQAQFHALAERKRRNKVREYFISLSRVVPGIRKMDKSTILEDATNHIKELEERITTLEKETKENVATSQSRNHTCNVIDAAVEGEMPEIKVIIFERNVLIKILCHKKYQGRVLQMSEEFRKLHLIINSTNVLQFGDSAIDITFGAKMETQFSATVDDIINHLQDAIFQVEL